MISRWIVTNITSASVATFLAFLAGIISWSVYCTFNLSYSLGVKKQISHAYEQQAILQYLQFNFTFFFFFFTFLILIFILLCNNTFSRDLLEPSQMRG
jgi:hypothetical protein